jgi:hypothetical protein
VDRGLREGHRITPAAWKTFLEADVDTAAMSGMLMLADFARGDKKIKMHCRPQHSTKPPIGSSSSMNGDLRTGNQCAVSIRCIPEESRPQ